MNREILELFKVMVVGNPQGLVNYDNIDAGFVTDFVPTADQLAILKEVYKPLDMITLFTVEERENSDPYDLLVKQFLHYVEIYGLNAPGLFGLEVDNGQVANLAFVKGVTKAQLQDMLVALLYSNAPVKDAPAIKKLVDAYDVAAEIDINEVKNNELKVLLFDVSKDKFDNGDDAVRYLVYQATEKSLLIKSAQVIASVKAYAGKYTAAFFEKHKLELAQVFNRHKPLILAAKTSKTKAVINEISRLSKVEHVPIKEGINKRFIRLALTGELDDVLPVLNKVSVRDKFKFLNLLEHKKARHDIDVFVIRNGKVHVEPNRPLYDTARIEVLINRILVSLADDLGHLRGSKILLDSAVDYGLPISRKQAMGNLPFGTKVKVEGSHISSGIWWHNDGGAHDLDLSTVDMDGARTGWGMYSGYGKDAVVTFSGDVTNASGKGAMEFMTSKTDTEPYGLFVNIYSGEIGSEMELVIGTKSKDQWIENPLVREKHKLDSRGNAIGFVKGDTFVVYATRLNASRVSSSGKEKALVSRGTSELWTVKKLLNSLQIEFDEVTHPETNYDYDLRYTGVSYDKLERMLFKN